MEAKFSDKELLTNWNTIGAAIGVRADRMVWALKNRDNMQKRIKLGKRVVYKSAPCLNFVQSRLITLLEPLMNALPLQNCSIAYRRGVSPQKVLREVRHAKVLISFDIRHYYDSITLELLEKCLMRCGLPRLGARLVGRYNVVQNGGRHTLQQGSPCSPVLSNIVGNVLIDQPINEWIKTNYPNLDVSYIRYCDNVALFIHDNIPSDFKERYKNAVREILAKSGLKSHKWATVADNHPVMHQKFLGMVLNAHARVDMETLDRLRAEIFNCMRNGFLAEFNKYQTSEGYDASSFVSSSILKDMYIKHLKGRINYISAINPTHGLLLTKMLNGAKYIRDRGEQVLPKRLFEAYKKYNDKNQSLEDYMASLKV